MTSKHPLRTLKLALCAGAFLAVAAGSSRTSYADGNYDLKPEQVGDCHAGAECVVKLTATTKGEFHVNESYPFKLTLAGAGVEFHGSGGATFTGGDFERQGKTVGVMTIKFKPSAKGAVTLTGKYKVCFCTDKECAPSTIDVSIPVTVK
ncbi:MAG: hypothetical protein ACLQVI_41935 [Polyangiaceae bacterium]|jgi:hypothetical protein